MSFDSRAFSELLERVNKTLKTSDDVNIEEILQWTLESFNEARCQLEAKLRRLEDICTEYERQTLQKRQRLRDLSDSEREVKKFKAAQYDASSKELASILESDVQQELLEKAREVRELSLDIRDLEHLKLQDVISTKIKSDVVRLRCYESFGLKLDKVKDLDREKVWELIECLHEGA